MMEDQKLSTCAYHHILNWAVRFQQQHTALALTDGSRPGQPRHADDRVETLSQALLAITHDRSSYQAMYWMAPLLCDQMRRNCRSNAVTSRCVNACGGWVGGGSGHAMCRHVVMLLDSDISHTVKSTTLLARRPGIKLVWLPKRTPESTLM